jgi:hypothetical protein
VYTEPRGVRVGFSRDRFSADATEIATGAVSSSVDAVL